MSSDEPRITISVERKLNLGNYESAGVGLVLSGVPVGATVKEIDAMLDTGKIMYDQMRVRLQEQVVERRRQGGAA